MTEPKTNEFTVDAGELQAEINELKQLQKSSSEKSGDLGARKTAIAERKGYHKAALNMILKIDAMSETNREDYLRTFVPMFEAMNTGWQGESNDMLDALDADTAPEPTPEDDMGAETTTEEGLEDFNETIGGNVESLHGDVA